MANTYTYPRREEIANAITHGIGAALSVLCAGAPNRIFKFERQCLACGELHHLRINDAPPVSELHARARFERRESQGFL